MSSNSVQERSFLFPFFFFFYSQSNVLLDFIFIRKKEKRQNLETCTNKSIDAGSVFYFWLLLFFANGVTPFLLFLLLLLFCKDVIVYLYKICAWFLLEVAQGQTTWARYSCPRRHYKSRFLIMANFSERKFSSLMDRRFLDRISSVL